MNAEMAASARPSSSAFRIEEFVAIRKNSLRGFAKVQMPSGMTLTDCTVHVTNGRPWAGPPSKPLLDRNGVAMRDEAGKLRYSPIVTFATKQQRDRFSAAIVEAVALAYPEALASPAESDAE